MLALAFASTAFARCEDYPPQPKPQNTAPRLVGADLDTILERGYIEFAVYDNFPPWSYSEGGKPVGIDVEIGELIAADMGVDARFNLVPFDENLQADLRNWIWKGPLISGQVSNVMLHVPYDSNFACRVEQVVFTGQYHVEEIAIAYREETYPDNPPVPAYFRFDQVAVENDTIADFYLSSLSRGQLVPNVKRYRTTELAMQALVDGEINAVMGAKGQLQAEMVPGFAVHTPNLPGFGLGSWTLGVAVEFTHRPLAYEVDNLILIALHDGRIAEIFARYYVDQTIPEYR